MFKVGHPHLEVGHHTHTIANVAIAVRHKIPTLILLRDPLDAISSAIVASRKRDPDNELLRYVTFYRWVEQHVASVLLVHFETIVGDWNAVINRVNSRFKTSFSIHDDIDQARRQTRERLLALYSDKTADRRVTNMPLPTEERRRLKEHWTDIIYRHPMMPEAQRIYQRLLPLCETDDSSLANAIQSHGGISSPP